MKSPLHIARRLGQRWSERRRHSRFASSVRHLHGPTHPDIATDDVLLIALVKDGSYYLDSFFDYYRGLGVKHFAFVDNGSTDTTIERIKSEPGTILDQSTLPLAGYEDLIRRYPADTYGRDRWCLYVDMDEQFDFVGREVLGLEGLVATLEAQGATALVAQMLEMFPKAPLAETSELSFEQSLSAFSYFDLSTVQKFDYHSTDIPFSDLLTDNKLPHRGIQFFFGGVRGKVFGENCCLTKHPLIFNSPGVTAAPHPHLSMGVKCADFTALIKHYKFAGDSAARDAQSMHSGALAHGEDAARASVMQNTPEVSLFSLDARPWNRIELLERAGFLVGSDRLKAHIDEAKK